MSAILTLMTPPSAYDADTSPALLGTRRQYFKIDSAAHAAIFTSLSISGRR